MQLFLSLLSWGISRVVRAICDIKMLFVNTAMNWFVLINTKFTLMFAWSGVRCRSTWSDSSHRGHPKPLCSTHSEGIRKRHAWCCHCLFISAFVIHLIYFQNGQRRFLNVTFLYASLAYRVIHLRKGSHRHSSLSRLKKSVVSLFSKLMAFEADIMHTFSLLPRTKTMILWTVAHRCISILQSLCGSSR